MQLVENTVVAGRFRLNRLIQRGGMGSVWHATHLGLDIPCAVKFVKWELVDQVDVMSRFEREAKAAAQLRSPHVVQILDHGECEGTPYIAMELLVGEDLDARLRRMRVLLPEELVKIVHEVCRALTKAHGMGIVHRDLKPANIFIVKDDDHEITKVLDFGIAKTTTSELGGSGTKTGAMLGTPYYMSPEQAQGTRAVDFRSDLWSLAVIAFECLTGRLPFESAALGDLLMKIMMAPLPRPSECGSVPPGFDAWWGRAAARDPAQRFQSAREFSESLAAVCGISHASGVFVPARSAAAAPPWNGAPPTGPGVYASGEPMLPAGAATPPPLSRTTADPPARPKAGAIVAIALGAIVFTATLSAGGWFAFHNRAPHPTVQAAPTPVPPATSPGVAKTDPPTATASSPAASVNRPAPAQSAPVAPVATNAPVEPLATAKPSAPSTPHVPSTPATAATASPKPSKPAKSSDLGF